MPFDQFLSNSISQCEVICCYIMSSQLQLQVSIGLIIIGNWNRFNCRCAKLTPNVLFCFECMWLLIATIQALFGWLIRVLPMSRYYFASEIICAWVRCEIFIVKVWGTCEFLKDNDARRDAYFFLFGCSTVHLLNQIAAGQFKSAIFGYIVAEHFEYKSPII